MALMLTAGQQAIIDRLSRGPATTTDLALACGYAAGERRGAGYVAMTLTRLTRRGWRFHNYRRRGSRLGGEYVLVARPHETGGPRRCSECGCLLGGWNDGPRCSPCEDSYRRLVELPWPRLLRLPLEPAPTGVRERVGA